MSSMASSKVFTEGNFFLRGGSLISRSNWSKIQNSYYHKKGWKLCNKLI